MFPILLAFFMNADTPITEISLERTACFGTCPMDKVTLRSDGTAEYTGTRFVRNLGKHTGKVGKAEFEKLAKRLEEIKFFDLDDRYSKPVTDLPSYITEARREGKAKKVVNYASAAPKGLEEIEKEIVKVMEKIKWTKAE